MKYCPYSLLEMKRCFLTLTKTSDDACWHLSIEQITWNVLVLKLHQHLRKIVVILGIWSFFPISSFRKLLETAFSFNRSERLCWSQTQIDLIQVRLKCSATSLLQKVVKYTCTWFPSKSWTVQVSSTWLRDSFSHFLVFESQRRISWSVLVIQDDG